MVARLKLKEIDGRAPPGVKHTEASSALLRTARPPIEVGGSLCSLVPISRGNVSKLRGPPAHAPYPAHPSLRGKDGACGRLAADLAPRAVQRLDGCGLRARLKI
jgi:hypothetical protein